MSEPPKNAKQFKTKLREFTLYLEWKYKGGAYIGYIFREMRDRTITTITIPAKLTRQLDQYDKAICMDGLKKWTYAKAQQYEIHGVCADAWAVFPLSDDQAQQTAGL